MLLVPAAIFGLVITGCGGANGILNGLEGSNAFAGTYSGNWTGSSGDAGSLTNVVIDVSGNVSGNFVSSTGSVGSLSGTVSSAGGFQWVATFTTGSDTLVGSFTQETATINATGVAETGLENQTLAVNLTLISNATKKRTAVPH
ncbi:MAG TPA: hypothetical protein VGL56_02740 [Fimbriimonadaceae bacterium]